MENFAKVTFTRNLADDLDVVRDAGLGEQLEPLKAQFLSEFGELASSFTMVEARSLAGPDYQFIVNVDLGNAVNQSPSECLDRIVAVLQEPYTAEVAAGHFDVETIVLNGTEFDASELLAARAARI